MNILESTNFREIVDLAKKDKNIIALILFGSYAKNSQKKNSDIDLCIIKKREIIPSEIKILDFSDNNFDIVFYDSLPDYIKFRVFQEGKVLVINDDFLYSKIKRDFLHVYNDGYYFRERQNQKLLAKI